MKESYLESALYYFQYYKDLAEKAIAQVSDEQLHWAPNPEVNSIAVIVKHMAGNMRSRHTDFLTSDGEKPWRQRDEEFIDRGESRADLLERWEEGWTCLFEAFEPLSDNDLPRRVVIRGEAHSVVQAINRQLAHLSYHVGQIVMLAKVLAGEEWRTLTIPRGESQRYNQQKIDNQ